MTSDNITLLRDGRSVLHGLWHHPAFIQYAGALRRISLAVFAQPCDLELARRTALVIYRISIRHAW